MITDERTLQMRKFVVIFSIDSKYYNGTEKKNDLSKKKCRQLCQYVKFQITWYLRRDVYSHCSCTLFFCSWFSVVIDCSISCTLCLLFVLIPAVKKALNRFKFNYIHRTSHVRVVSTNVSFWVCVHCVHASLNLNFCLLPIIRS